MTISILASPIGKNVFRSPRAGTSPGGFPLQPEVALIGRHRPLQILDRDDHMVEPLGGEAPVAAPAQQGRMLGTVDRLGVLDQDAATCLGMQKGDNPGQAVARLLIDQPNALVFGVLQLGVDIVGLETQMV